jgi:hypothetical protein
MSYILKNTSGKIITRITDVGRKAISKGLFNISYFQVGDSEIDYIGDNITNNNVLMPAFCEHNDNAGGYNVNKQNVKYPYFLNGAIGTTYGIPFNESTIKEFYNLATDKGFFVSGVTTYSAQTTSAYTVSSNFIASMPTITGQTSLLLSANTCSATTGVPKVGDFLTIILDGVGDCGSIRNSFPILTYKISASTISGSNYIVGLDRNLPIYSAKTSGGEIARCLIYPSGMTALYDSVTPMPNWSNDVFNYETVCDTSATVDTRVWNMNIPWSQTVAGITGDTYEDYTKYGSQSYLGTKEYLYSNSGQTLSSDNGAVYYYDSRLNKIIVESKNQKAIAVIHYTNQSIDNVYGEKFATMPFDAADPKDTNDLARKFKLTIPTLMWHKSDGSSIGQSFYIDPPNEPGKSIPYYIKSTKNSDMNQPGIRFFNLWDTNENSKNELNRVGRVFPDSKIVVIDDDELVAALSYKSNRNWTLPAPEVSLITPNLFDTDTSNDIGVLTGDGKTLWVTYRLDSTDFTNSLHCNYYQNIVGPDTGCTITAQNVAVKFGEEFPFLYTNNSLSGFSANEIKILAQRTNTGSLPEPNQWRIIDFTSQIASTKINGYIPESGLTKTTFVITESNYTAATIYDLAKFIDVPLNSEPTKLNFGDEYYFYGNIQTGIVATIYEMKYAVNLVETQFSTTTNPTYVNGKNKYITEIGLYNSNKELMVISKLSSPVERIVGDQQFNISLDF